jgi:hypothetical protein
MPNLLHSRNTEENMQSILSHAVTGMSRALRRTAAASALYCVLAVNALIALPQPVTAQQEARSQLNFLLPVEEIEQLLTDGEFRIIDWRGARKPEDRTQRVAIAFDDTVVFSVQWANAPKNGATFNNQPRYELAAYVLQKMFLDPDDYVVPPTVIRSFPLDFVRAQVPEVRPTFDEAPASVLVALQYWLLAVTPDNVWDAQRARRDSVYARHFGNLNVLTYIINHGDSNTGNVLLSESTTNPRVYAVDNGVAFTSMPSDRGFIWRDLLAERLSRATVERLRTITRADLDRALGVLVEFEIRDGQLVAVEPGANMGTGRGVRRSRNRVQLGLTSQEIQGVERRIRALLRESNGMQLF